MPSNKKTCSAFIKVVPASYYKLNLVAGLIRKMKVQDAKKQLSFSAKKCAYFVAKLLDSCIANARNNFNMNVDNLVVEEVLVGRAFMLKRFMPRGRGRSTRIEKRYANMKIVVSEASPEVANVVAKKKIKQN